MKKNFFFIVACVFAIVVAGIDITVYIRSISSIVSLEVINSTDVVFILAIMCIAYMYSKCQEKLASFTSKEEEKLLIYVGGVITKAAALFQLVAVVLPFVTGLFQ